MPLPEILVASFLECLEVSKKISIEGGAVMQGVEIANESRISGFPGQKIFCYPEVNRR
jgi:hypothetical protein